MQSLAQPQTVHQSAQHAVIHRTSCTAGARRAVRRRHVVHAERKFNEGAAQVKRLLNRDRSGVPDLDKPASFDTDDVASDDGSGAASENGSQQPAAESSGRLSEPFPLPGKSQLAKPSPFGGGAVESPLSSASPFGSSSSRKPFQEPSGLSPDMEMSPISDVPWWRSITLTQVAIAFSFLLTISLMVATFWVVWKMGAIRLNE